MSTMSSVRFVKIGSDWVAPSQIAAVERRPGGGSRIHLKSGASLAYEESITPDDVVQTMFAAEVRSTDTTGDPLDCPACGYDPMAPHNGKGDCPPKVTNREDGSER